jgi:hypothetical protein
MEKETIVSQLIEKGWKMSNWFDTYRSRGRHRRCRMCHKKITKFHLISPKGTHYHFDCLPKIRSL